ncbi:methyltransferase domain-containing protein [Cyanothece sp. BG0011]|uniref:class I SAM-dependent methyltransferase n=1 Tax=Cyanothece sp. BG0011 TaxID=2082950 RepID=UPI000D1F3FFE|nr:methyltransferase domain-containing protein [Cyanothece sp. BG0011]
MKKINLGCGERYTKGWINLDFNSHHPDVVCHNLLSPFPFHDEEVDVIYNSHFLEHFSREEAKKILTECHRVLKKKGIIRIVVPDLENICREYLKLIDNIEDIESQEKYQWVIIELLDQMVRTEKWGLMNIYWQQIVEKDNQFMIDYINSRMGYDIRQYYTKAELPNASKSQNFNLTKIKTEFLNWYIKLIKNLLPPAYRQSINDNTMLGEKHKWMYDKYSLRCLLQEAQFSHIRFLDATTSNIPNFCNDHLDINLDGTPYRESSLYCEAYK